MIELSSRHALPLAALLWLLALPIAYHAIEEPRVEDCAAPEELEVPRFASVTSGGVLASVRVDPKGGAPRDGKLLNTGLDWKNGPLWTVVRSWDPGEAYFAPPGLFSFDNPDARTETLDANGHARLPVQHRSFVSERWTNSALYLYVLGGEPVARPLLARLRRAPEQLWRGTLPLTVILVEADFDTARSDEHRALLLDWIRAAWSRYREVCR